MKATQLINLTEALLKPHQHSSKACFLVGDSSVSYKALYQDVIKLSLGLQQAGIKAGMSLVVGLNDSIASVVTFLSCCAIGARPLLVNPKLDQPTLQHLLDTAQASMLVTEQDGKVMFNAQTIACKGGDYQQLLSNGSDNCNNCNNNKDHSDFVFHYQTAQTACFFQSTSGSTGKPKLVTHTALSALSSAEQVCQQWLTLDSNAVFYSVAKLFFGYGMGNSLLFPLSLGATAVLDNEWPTPERVKANLLQHKPTVFGGVPAMYQALLDDTSKEPSATNIKSNLFASVNIALSAGSPLPRKLFRAYQRQGIELLNGIGATELCHIFIANSPDKAQAGETGYPLSGYQTKLVDDCGEEVPSGEVGSLLIKGPSVAAGYWRNETATAHKFNNGWYDSGDMFQQNAAGALVYKGRTDDLFKVNGRWVNPVLVEAAILAQFGSLVEAIMVPYQIENGLTYGYLFITTREGVSLPTGNLMSWCRQEFPSYRCPISVQQLDQLPRNANGKLDRRALSQMANDTVTAVYRRVS